MLNKTFILYLKKKTITAPIAVFETQKHSQGSEDLGHTATVPLAEPVPTLQCVGFTAEALVVTIW